MVGRTCAPASQVWKAVSDNAAAPSCGSRQLREQPQVSAPPGRYRQGRIRRGGIRLCGWLDDEGTRQTPSNLPSYLAYARWAGLPPCSPGSGRPDPRASCQTDLGTSEKDPAEEKPRSSATSYNLRLLLARYSSARLSTYSIDDRCDALTLGRQVSVKGASMNVQMLGNLIYRTKSAWQQHPDDLACSLRRLVAEVGELHVQPSLHLAIQRRVCSRD